MLVIGSANGAKIVISLVRMKVLAVLLGPTGVGLLSIYNNLAGYDEHGGRPWDEFQRRPRAGQFKRRRVGS